MTADETVKSQGCLAPAENDIKYAAFALCNVAAIAQSYLDLREAVTNPELILAADWKMKATELHKNLVEVSEANSKKFNALIDQGDRIEKLQEEKIQITALAKDLVRLLKEGKPIPSFESLEKMFT